MVLVIPTHRRRDELLRLFRSLDEMTPPARHRLEIVLIENDEAARLPDWFDPRDWAYPVHVFHEDRIGLVHARNRGLEEAARLAPEVILGLDDDEWVDPDWIAAFEAALAALPGHDILIGRPVYVYGDDLSPWMPRFQVPHRFLGEMPFISSTQTFALRRSVWADDGAALRFDPAFNRIGAEDTDFFERARARGLRTGFVPASVVYEAWDKERAGFRYNLNRQRRNTANGLRIAARGPGPRIAVAKRMWRIVRMSIRRAFFYAVRGAIRYPGNREAGRREFGQATLNLGRILAIGDFAFDRKAAIYGQSAQKSA